MDILGREKYENFLLKGDGGFADNFFLESLKFSTHGEFFYSNRSLNLNHDFMHFHYDPSIINKKEYFSIFKFSGNYFKISKGNIGSFAYPEVIAESNFLQSKFAGLKSIKFVINHDHSIEYLGSINLKKEFIFNPVLIEEFLEIDNFLDGLLPGTLINITLHDDSRCILKFNYLTEWSNLYALHGINIPLIIIQILLGRQIKSIPMVGANRIKYAENKYSYSLRKDDTFWFDLDETLICRNKVIHEANLFLNNLKKNNIAVNLITRHTFDINKTLLSINIDPKIFNKIIKVPSNKKKSSFMTGKGYFLDNEFPERFDIFKNTKIIPIDLVQMKYFYF